MLNFENTVDAAEFLLILLKYTSHLFKVLFGRSVKAFLALTLSDRSILAYLNATFFVISICFMYRFVNKFNLILKLNFLSKIGI